MNSFDQQQVMNSQIKIKPQAMSVATQQPWYSRALAALAALMHGAPKIYTMQDHPAELDIKAPEINITQDSDKLDVNEYFSDHGDGAFLYPELTKFIKAYRCSRSFEDKAILLMLHGGYQFGPRHFYDDKEFIIKGSAIDRLINARRMKNYFKQHHLDLLDVVDKCLILGQGSLFLMSKKITFDKQMKKVSQKEAEQLAQFGLGTGYWDWGFGENVIRDPQGKLIFIDTEDAAFEFPSSFHDREHVLNYLFLDLQEADQKEASDSISEKYNQIKNSKEGRVLAPLLFRNSEYDDPDIDFEQVKKEFKEFEASKK